MSNNDSEEETGFINVVNCPISTTIVVPSKSSLVLGDYYLVSKDRLESIFGTGCIPVLINEKRIAYSVQFPFRTGMETINQYNCSWYCLYDKIGFAIIYGNVIRNACLYLNSNCHTINGLVEYRLVTTKPDDIFRFTSFDVFKYIKDLEDLRNDMLSCTP